ncbi:hypothetical protein RPN21_10540 [Klebsiella aerogenes]|uniref:hypothetical protein n=1 Tax=Klebsiella aerogenes TaxID=548 RepID=UPI0028A5728B|nr:hypothetical protein [Klebsiella aerogenes]MDT4308953.1 hypothetical protein [Klebsiella aerogenes]
MLTGATNQIPNRSPDKALRAAIRESSPVALTLTGATDRIPNRSPDKALRAAIRESFPGGAYAYRGYQPNTEP